VNRREGAESQKLCIRHVNRHFVKRARRDAHVYILETETNKQKTPSSCKKFESYAKEDENAMPHEKKKCSQKSKGSPRDVMADEGPEKMSDEANRHPNKCT